MFYDSFANYYGSLLYYTARKPYSLWMVLHRRLQLRLCCAYWLGQLLILLWLIGILLCMRTTRIDYTGFALMLDIKHMITLLALRSICRINDASNVQHCWNLGSEHFAARARALQNVAYCESCVSSRIKR